MGSETLFSLGFDAVIDGVRVALDVLVLTYATSLHVLVATKTAQTLVFESRHDRLQ